MNLMINVSNNCSQLITVLYTSKHSPYFYRGMDLCSCSKVSILKEVEVVFDKILFFKEQGDFEQNLLF